MAGALSCSVGACEAFYQEVKRLQVVVGMQEEGMLSESPAPFLNSTRLGRSQGSKEHGDDWPAESGWPELTC